MRLWNIVLAAGAGRRLAHVTGGVPKQFFRSADGRPTLLEDTLTRTAPLAPPARTVIVVDELHRTFIQALPEVRRSGDLIYQPGDRGTAAGVLFGLLPVAAADPDAIVLVTPSDHGVGRLALFQAGIREATGAVRSGREAVVLFGVEPATAEGDYGWIAPVVPSNPASRFKRVGRFVEKPPAHVAERLFATDAVWNTMVLVARLSSLVEQYRRHLPDVLAAFTAALEQENRMEALAAEYPRLRPSDFSRDLLSHAGGLALHTWPATMGWSDLGTPERLAHWRENWPARVPAAIADAGPDSCLLPAC